MDPHRTVGGVLPLGHVAEDLDDVRLVEGLPLEQGVGKAIEGVGSLFSQRKRDPEVRLTRTQMRD